MGTNQEERQQDIRDATSTSGNIGEDWHALFDSAGIASGSLNERLLMWINAELSASYTSLPATKQAYAENQGVANWDSLNAITITP